MARILGRAYSALRRSEDAGDFNESEHQGTVVALIDAVAQRLRDQISGAVSDGEIYRHIEAA